MIGARNQSVGVFLAVMAALNRTVEGRGNQERQSDDLPDMSTMMKRPIWLLLIVAGLSLGAAGCGDGDSDDGASGETLTIADQWSRAPADGQTRTAVYGTISNPNDSDATISGASSDAAESVELHETITDDEGSMSMSEVEDGFVVPAEGELVLEPGGHHVMMFGIDPDEYEGEVSVTLEVAGGDLTFDAEIRESTDVMNHDSISHDDDMDMDDDSMSHDDMEMDDDMEKESDSETDGES